MKKTILVICSAVLMAACNNTTNNTEKDMNTLTFNEKQASCISTIACYEAQGNLGKLAESINNGLDNGLTVSQIKDAEAQRCEAAIGTANGNQAPVISPSEWPLGNPNRISSPCRRMSAKALHLLRKVRPSAKTNQDSKYSFQQKSHITFSCTKIELFHEGYTPEAETPFTPSSSGNCRYLKPGDAIWSSEMLERIRTLNKIH